MKLSTMIEVLGAAAHVWIVDWHGFKQQGGIFLCAPPGQLKTFLLSSLENIPGVRGISDLTSRELDKLHSKIESREIKTLAFYELPKIYERNPVTSTNIMGHIRSLVDEGFTGISANQSGIRSRCTVIAAMPLKFQRAHEAEWDENGMSRRVIFCRFILDRPEQIERAVVDGKRISARTSFPTPFECIPLNVTKEESTELLSILKRGDQATGTPLILLKKIVTVLRWKAREMHRKDNSMDLVREFSESMYRGGAEVAIDT